MAEKKKKRVRVQRSEEEIARIRAERSEKRARKTSEEELEKYFPNKKATREFLKNLAKEIRQFRKNALEKGLTKVSLPEELKRPYYLAFTKLAPDSDRFNQYRDELQELSIEGLKIQDRELKIFTFNYNDKLFQEGFYDWGWIVRMLSRKYVSRYGWALLRKHSDKLSQLGGQVIGQYLDEWADDPKTWENWTILAKNDGKPIDMREIFKH